MISNTKKGFTLIELLVVVSIIALLSSVVVAALSDAREGAKNNKRNELVRQYVTALGLYHGEYGKYPGNNTTRYCLGSGYPSGNCYVVGSHTENLAVNNALTEFAPGMPASLESTNAGGNTFLGIAYSCLTSDCEDYKLEWVVKGSGSSAECFGGATKTNSTGDLGICTYSTI